MTNTLITYEQPLSEHIRVCLRLEQLFNKITNLTVDPSPWRTQATVSTIVDILMILDRADLKAKFTKALSYSITKLAPYKKFAQVDQTELQAILTKLDNLLNYLINSTGKIAHKLRDNELLNDLRQHHSNFGDPACMDTPAYHYWLNQSEEYQQNFIDHWLGELKETQAITDILLYLTRDGRTAVPKVANNGFYSENFDPRDNYRLIRITLPKTTEAYPEISVGRHRVNIRFYTPKSDVRTKPVDHAIQFDLTCCN